MCGICGIVAPGGVDRDRLAAMSATLAHRGPDSDGLVVDGAAGLAARRLAIIDLDTGDQPVANEDGTVHVVQNGELYNYRALRDELASRGHRLRSEGDTEVIAHLYEEHGHRFADRLRGMFAIALWDARRGRLVLARDRFGIKPLAYRLTPAGLEFASELRALAPGAVDLDALAGFLACNAIPGPRTIYRDVRKLPPGHVLVWEDGRTHLERYARPAPVPAGRVRSESPQELAEELRGRLADSVRAHLVADVPVGVFLSGGIDSSLLVALASHAGAEPVRTYSVGVRSSPAGTARATRSSSCNRTPPASCPPSPRPSTSRSPTRRRCPPTSCPSWPRGTSRSRSPAKAATSCSAATSRTRPT